MHDKLRHNRKAVKYNPFPQNKESPVVRTIGSKIAWLDLLRVEGECSDGK